MSTITGSPKSAVSVTRVVPGMRAALRAIMVISIDAGGLRAACRPLQLALAVAM
jgi:hypothetical protein